MKTARIVLLTGVAHFGLWWASYVILLWFDFDVLPASQLSTPLQILLQIHRMLTFPLMLDPVNSAVQNLPVALVTATNGVVWAGCLGSALYAYRRICQIRAD